VNEFYYSSGSQKYETKLKELNLPQYSFKIAEGEKSDMIFDSIRKKYVKLTDEEWVRQNFIQYLIMEGKYAPGLIGVEVTFPFNRMKRRIDILVHDRTGKPVMIIECKSPDIEIDDKVFDQIVNYNMEYKVPYIVVTNGLVHYICKVNIAEKSWEFLNVIPLFEDLLT
jgi:predicted type IV restriction endonuclease